jgi:plasmid stabilization system protein ParE
MRIRWTLAAVADLEGIKDYLQEYYPHLAQPTVLKLYEGIRWVSKGEQDYGHSHQHRLEA